MFTNYYVQQNTYTEFQEFCISEQEMIQVQGDFKIFSPKSRLDIFLIFMNKLLLTKQDVQLKRFKSAIFNPSSEKNALESSISEWGC